jgi:hypothetical protein
MASCPPWEGARVGNRRRPEKISKVGFIITACALAVKSILPLPRAQIFSEALGVNDFAVLAVAQVVMDLGIDRIIYERPHGNGQK